MIYKANKSKLPAVFLLLALIIGVCYSNTLNASWHFDDYPNIINNPGLHLEHISIDAIWNCFFNATPSGGTFRPIAYLTFAFNWFTGGTQVVGYHVINILVHMLAAFFLFLTIQQILTTPNITCDLQKNAFSIALLTSVVWAVHPIQIQAVTYIVQRMTSMAALFFILSVWAYLSGRTSSIPYKKTLWYLGCFLSWTLAVLTKQNTVTLPLILLLLEFIFFQNWRSPMVKRCYWGIIIVGVLVLIAGICFLIINGDAGPYMGKYQIRPYTPIERLLTQFRVVLFYLFQIVYPVPGNFSITHDFMISRSLLNPWTTLPAIGVVLGMVSVSVWAISKGPFLKIMGFSILFFSINHLIESTILPLEMVFEHRNYLPSFFLFIPFAIGINKAFDIYHKQSKPMFYFLVLSTCALLISMGISTYLRNMDWQSEKTLWQDAMKKAPHSSRPPHNIALGYYEPAGMYNQAIDLYHHALELNDESIGFESTIFFNIAAIYFSSLQDYEKTIEYAFKALQIDRNHDRALYLLARSLAELGHYGDALNVIAPRLHKKNTSPANMHLNGLILLNLSQPETALVCFQKCMARDPGNWLYLREIGFALSAMEMQNRARWFFRRANALYPNQPEILLGRAAVNLEYGLLKKAETNVEQFILSIGIDNVENYWVNASAAPLGLPIPYSRLTPMICRFLFNQSEGYAKMSQRLLNIFSEK
ncbi:MAG: tetratricopeptide repeat protein [Desulfobacteraceae bacterium]|nr:tetratricopeptide repeat protein [Desulfobacteraceae bacterium]